jgi:peptide/nickel transport system substrate-binding protein
MDLNKARQLLDDAGWKSSGGTAIRQKDGKPLSFTISMLHHKEIGEYLATQFKQIGADMKIEVIPGPVQLQKVGNGDFDVMYERLRSFEPDDLFSIWYSKNNQPGGWAWSRFQDDKLDDTLLKTQTTADPSERCKQFIAAQQIILDKALALHTLDTPIYYAMDKSVKNFKLGAIGAWFFVKDMYIQK